MKKYIDGLKCYGGVYPGPINRSQHLWQLVSINMVKVKNIKQLGIESLAIPKTPFVCSYDWDYKEEDERLSRLIRLGIKYAWDEETTINWKLDTPPAVQNLPDNFRCQWSDFQPFQRLKSEQKLSYLKDYRAWVLSQVLHGEQGALLASAQLVMNAPSMDAKRFAGSQVFDEARHVSVFNHYLELRGLKRFPVGGSLKKLLDMILSDVRWDHKFIGMQLIIENLALASFNQLKISAYDPLFQNIIKYVARDEARHVAFGVNYLQKIVSQLTKSEREYREEFAFQACDLSLQNAKPIELWQQYEWSITDADDYFKRTKDYQYLQQQLSLRIIPQLKKIGLYNASLKKRYRDIGLDC